MRGNFLKYLKVSPTSKAHTCMIIYPKSQKWKFGEEDRLLYKQFIHLTRINLRSNIPFCEYSAVRLSVIFRLPPDSPPIASLWHAG